MYNTESWKNNIGLIGEKSYTFPNEIVVLKKKKCDRVAWIRRK